MLNLENEGNLIAVLQNKDKNIKDKKLYVSSETESVKSGGVSFSCASNETLQLVPNIKAERQCLYVCGQSGSGKSHFTTEYVKQYKKMYPKRDIFVISSIEEDSSIDSLKPKRINVLHPEFMHDEFTSEDFKDSLVIFDDIDVFPTKVREKVMEIVNNLLIVGRHFNASLIMTTHNPTNGAEKKYYSQKPISLQYFQQQQRIGH